MNLNGKYLLFLNIGVKINSSISIKTTTTDHLINEFEEVVGNRKNYS